MPDATFTLPPLPELRSAKVFGQTIRYYDVGSGSPLVLIHGIGGDADDWAFVLNALASKHRVIALELLGFGRSAKPHIDYTIAGYVEVLGRFLHALGIERAALVGHSLGGWIAAAFALASPQAVDKLVLVDSAGVWGDMAALPVDLHVSTLAHMRQIFQFLFYDKRLASDSLIEFAYAQHLERGDGYTIHSILKNTCDGRERLDDEAERISALTVPTLLVWGENDAMIPLEIGRRIHELVPGSKLEVIPQCGHMPNLEKPAEIVRCVLEFLA
jgi:2-hydroxy-6-oxonona-2,4-dienedioate hydrolase